MVVDIEREVVVLHDCSERGELFLRSVNQQEGDREVHVLGVEPARVDRALEAGTNDLLEHLECLRQLHVPSTRKGEPRFPARSSNVGSTGSTGLASERGVLIGV